MVGSCTSHFFEPILVVGLGCSLGVRNTLTIPATLGQRKAKGGHSIAPSKPAENGRLVCSVLLAFIRLGEPRFVRLFEEAADEAWSWRGLVPAARVKFSSSPETISAGPSFEVKYNIYIYI